MVTVTELNRGFDFDGEDVTNVGALDADELQNIRFVSPNDDLQQSIDDLKSSNGDGVVYLLPGVHSTSNILVPAGITVESASSERSGTLVEPSSDAPIFDVESRGKVEDIHIDLSAVSGYSSAAIRVIGGFNWPSIISVENVRIEGGSNATGIEFFDGDGSGVAWSVIRDCDLRNLAVGVSYRPTSGGFVNSNRAENIRVTGCNVGVTEDRSNGGCSGNVNQIKANGGSGASLVHIEGPNKYEIQIADYGSFDQIIDCVYSGSETATVIDETPISNLLANSSIVDFGSIEILSENLRKYEHLFGPTAPEWAEQGTGQLNKAVEFGDFNTRIGLELESGASVGDTLSISGVSTTRNTGGGATPSITSELSLPSLSNIVARFGMAANGPRATSYQFVADPTNSLSTGITSNWIAEVVEDDGTTTRTDTGVALGDVSADVFVTDDNDGLVRFNLNGSQVEEVTLSSRERYLQPFASVETTTSTEKRLRLSDRLEWIKNS